jgi:serine/threonine protein kinase
MSEPGLMEQLRDCGLLSAEQIDSLGQLPEAASPDPSALAEAIVQRGWLTRFQIDQVAAGKGKGLFIGPYVVLSPIGRGGMGQVLKARHRHMNRVVALKLLRKDKLQSADAVRRFYREVEAAGQLCHPNIVLAFDAGQVGKTWFVAMEHIDGPDLAQLVQERGPLPVAQACDFIRQAALGLQHAHERGLVHRDVKPKNLLAAFHEDGTATVKVLDLGLARLGESSLKQNRSLTRLGQVLGTPAYLAPEQARDPRTADIRADVYGLGCSLFFLLTGRSPFQAQSRVEMLLKHQREEPPSVCQFRSDVPTELDSLLRVLLAKKPEQRLGEPAAVAAALAPFARAEHGAPVREDAAALAPVSSPRWTDSTDDATGGTAMIVRPRERLREGRSHLLPGAFLTVGALLLVGTVCTWLSWPSARPDKGNPVVMTIPAGKPEANKEPRPRKEKGAKKAPAPVGVSPALASAIEEAMRAGKATKTQSVGGGDQYYYEVAKGGGLLIGLEVGVGQRAGQEVISSLRAIYQSGQGRVLGALQGKQPQRTVTLEARPGHAVGALTIKGDARLHGLSVTFMAVNGQALEPSRAYTSEWVGGTEGQKHALAGDGRLVVGIFGKVDSRQAVAGALGLVTLAPLGPAGS